MAARFQIFAQLGKHFGLRLYQLRVTGEDKGVISRGIASWAHCLNFHSGGWPPLSVPAGPPAPLSE